MSTGIWMAASGAVAQLTSLDVTANNVANASTAGYKAEQATFSERLLSAAQAGKNITEMRFNSVGEVGTDFEAGPIRVTERGLDVAVRGQGFIAVQGPGGTEQYTRAGNLQLDASGCLRTGDGAQVLDASRKPIRLAMGTGEPRVGVNGEVQLGGETVAQLKLVQFDRPAGLTKVGHSFYQATQGSGPARVGGVELEPGALEMSNVSAVKGMTDMVTVTRSFDALEHVIDTFKAIEQRAATSLMAKR